MVETSMPAPMSQLERLVDAQLVATPTSLSGVVDAILEVNRQRKSLLDQLRAALQSGKDAEALQLARQFCGLPENNNEKGHRTD
jgi:hypothetical protein